MDMRDTKTKKKKHQNSDVFNPFADISADIRP